MSYLQETVRCVTRHMAKGICELIAPDPINPRGILFQVTQGSEDAPDDQLQLKSDVEQALTVISVICPEDTSGTKFNEYFEPLVSLARTGLQGNSANPKVARQALVALKNDVTTREGGRIKNQHMKTLGIWAIIIGGIPLIASTPLQLFSVYPLIKSLLFLWSACMAGVWVSFGARKANFQFEDLHIPEQDRVLPAFRLIFAGILSIIIGLLLSTQAIAINVGGVTTADLQGKPEIAVLLGMVCGFLEQTLPSKVERQASSILRL